MRAWLVALAVAATACSSGSKRVDRDEAARLLIDRNWIDVMPKSSDDRLHVFRFTPKMGGGVFQDRTVFRGEFELFKFRLTGDGIAFVFPDRHERYATDFAIEHVDGPEPFDLKLTLERSPRGPRVYYGMSAETGDLDALLADTADN
ncbi:MAG: hypothetical protein K8W52_17225 [Deltaproteobacteria bacterium]|nr:hypothetical protein [Deltaproteobacteria bacterium]